MEEFKALLRLHDKPQLSKELSMVYQVWEDGEITLQKSGDILWQRTLHSIESGFHVAVPVEWFPNLYGTHGYIFTDKEGAYAVRAYIQAHGS